MKVGISSAFESTLIYRVILHVLANSWQITPKEDMFKTPEPLWMLHIFKTYCICIVCQTFTQIDHDKYVHYQ